LADKHVKRRLAAILSADVTGYSRLMGVDEEGTLAALNAHRSELIDTCIGEHRGRLVKTTGDGLLAEFGSVVDAVRCAVTIQDGMQNRNAKVPSDQRIEFRIGVNVGDVIVQDDDVFGDSVNVAARLEGLAEPGGVCVSDMVYRSVRSNLDLSFNDLGPHRVKNIGDPVVHEQHGIGRYLGLVTMDLGEGPAEFLQLVYANDAKLYVPVANLHLIGRYSGASPEADPFGGATGRGNSTNAAENNPFGAQPTPDRSEKR
jgi:class 3 adenylate cyclase